MGTHQDQGTQLSDSLCARLCHELAGPLGTLVGTLEMAVVEPAIAAETLALATEAAEQMALRLRLLRAAWGGDCGALGVATLAGLAAGLPPRVSTDLGGLTGEFPGPVARVLVNMLLLAVEALPRGGVIHLSGTPEDDVVLTVDGPMAAWPCDLALVLSNPALNGFEEPRAVQAPLTSRLARAAGLRLALPLSSSVQATQAAPLLLTAA